MTPSFTTGATVALHSMEPDYAVWCHSNILNPRSLRTSDIQEATAVIQRTSWHQTFLNVGACG